MLGIGDYLWRLIPANPILLRVVQGASRRTRDLVIRWAYLAALVLLVIVMLLSGGSLGNAGLAELTKTSADLFSWMSYLQLFLVALLAPIFTAGAITQEKDNQTYDILLSTPLTNGQIVLGSLLSRLFFVIALLVSGVPIFAITQVFGGVAIRSIVLSFLIASATAFVTGAMAMAIAVLKVGTRRTIFSFYIVIALYLAVPMAIEQLGYLRFAWAQTSTGKPVYMSWMAGLHPFLALRVIFGDPSYRPPEPGMVQNYTWPINWYLSSPHTFYITLMFTLSFLLVAPSILLLRRLAQSSVTIRSWILQLLRLSKGDRTRRPRRVWVNPIAWREAKTKASANRAMVLRYGFMAAGTIGAITLLVMSTTRVQSDCYIGVGGYHEADKTITIVEDKTPVVYKLKPAFQGLRMSGKSIAPSDLREDMVVDRGSMIVDRGSRPAVIAAMSVGYPKTTLGEVETRRFLLGAVMVEVAVILLILTQSAASTVTREKEDGTLDLLLSTPITSRYYIWGKLRGLVSFALPLAAVPLFSLILFIVYDIMRTTPGRSGAWRGSCCPRQS